MRNVSRVAAWIVRIAALPVALVPKASAFHAERQLTAEPFL